MVDNPACGIVVSERYERLLAHELAWRELFWTETYRVQLTSAEDFQNPGGVLMTSNTPVGRPLQVAAAADLVDAKVMNSLF